MTFVVENKKKKKEFLASNCHAKIRKRVNFTTELSENR